MSVLCSGAILVAVNAATIATMLLVRRRAPAGSYFTDGDHASGVFGVLAGGFAIFAGFVTFSPSRPTTSRAAAGKPKRSPWSSSSRPPSPDRPRCATA